jgi:L-serine dehydratase
MNNELTNIYIEFDPNGSLATTHKSQGSDMGIFGGFMGWEAYDERLPLSENYLESHGIFVHIEIKDIQANHPNTYKLTLTNANEIHSLTAISTGGGMIEVIDIDQHKVSMAGDYFETLIYCDHPSSLFPIILDFKTYPFFPYKFIYMCKTIFCHCPFFFSGCMPTSWSFVVIRRLVLDIYRKLFI